MAFLALPFTATRLQAATYLLGVCLFSISFLVFLNSSISFVITDRIGQKKRVGDAVGTLGFADELVALVACPLWGMLSDRIGVRNVAVAGYAIVGISLFVFVQAKNVFPALLLGRLLFSLGGAATTTMVTAILPSMTYKPPEPLLPATTATRSAPNTSNHGATPSISSELTITPARYTSGTSSPSDSPALLKAGASSSKLAGIVGMLTGCGALVALGIFLPLPTRFQKDGASPSEAIADSFYVVGAVALIVSLFCLIGFRNLASEEGKGLKKLFIGTRSSNHDQHTIPTELPIPSYPRLFGTSLKLGVQDVNIGLGYIGGFVARASSVAISLFIPLYVNAYFISSGLCPEDPNDGANDPSVVKRNCQRAYIVASILTGVSQLIALLCAPIFGYLSATYTKYNLPLLLASASGVAGYAAFGRLKSPDPSGDNGNFGVFFIVALLGISQIGAIVCSLGLLARGIETEIPEPVDYFGIPTSAEQNNGHTNGGTTRRSEATTPLLPSHLRHIGNGSSSRATLKGSIAGIYSLAGGAGILLLTKVGGLMFDKVDVGSPFFLMAAFNGVLFIVTLACDAGLAYKSKPSYQPLLRVQEEDEDDFRDEG